MTVLAEFHDDKTYAGVEFSATSTHRGAIVTVLPSSTRPVHLYAEHVEQLRDALSEWLRERGRA